MSTSFTNGLVTIVLTAALPIALAAFGAQHEHPAGGAHQHPQAAKLKNPDAADADWKHGPSDGEIFTVIKRGVPPTMMAGFDGGIPDQDIWNIVNYLRSLRAGR